MARLVTSTHTHTRTHTHATHNLHTHNTLPAHVCRHSQRPSQCIPMLPSPPLCMMLEVMCADMQGAYVTSHNCTYVYGMDCVLCCVISVSPPEFQLESRPADPDGKVKG